MCVSYIICNVRAEDLVCMPRAVEPVRYRVSWHAQRVVNFRSPRPLATRTGQPRCGFLIIIFEMQARAPIYVGFGISNQIYRRAPVAHVHSVSGRYYINIGMSITRCSSNFFFIIFIFYLEVVQNLQRDIKTSNFIRILENMKSLAMK